MRVPQQRFDPGVLPGSKNYFFASPMTEEFIYTGSKIITKENAQEQIDTLKSYGTVEKIAEKQRAVFRFFTNTGHKAGKKL